MAISHPLCLCYSPPSFPHRTPPFNGSLIGSVAHHGGSGLVHGSPVFQLIAEEPDSIMSSKPCSTAAFIIAQKGLFKTSQILKIFLKYFIFDFKIFYI